MHDRHSRCMTGWCWRASNSHQRDGGVSSSISVVPGQAIAWQFIQAFKEFPPSQKSGSMNPDQVIKMLSSGAAGGGK